jgi:ribosome-associated toxin RatA of RatAB toxin-antitoxin module
MNIMKTCALFALFFSICIITPASSSSGKGWKQVIKKNGIQVFTRPVRGSEVDEFKAVTLISSEIEVLGEVMRDVPAQPQWIADCSHAKVVKKIGKNILFIYSIYKTPWPVTDRDTLIKTVTKVDPKNRWFTIYMNSVRSPLVPVRSDKVRIKKLKGRWVFKKIKNKMVKVTYCLTVDPGGSLPLWLANRTSKDSPYTTLSNLKRMVKLSKYQKKEKN